MRFLILADIHGHDAFLREILKAEPARDAAIIVGDLTQLGGAAEAEKIMALLATAGQRVLAVPGNMDRPDVLASLMSSGSSLHGTGVIIGDMGFFGAGGSNRTPFHTPFELTEDELERLMLAGLQSVKRAARKVLVSHTPPFRSKLDRIGLGTHAGSEAVRRFLKLHPVDYCLCAHIHEAAGEDTVEGVRCLNPGAVREGKYAIMEVIDGRIEVTRKNI
jgi:Icc-related predicted phosphoesterase